MSNKKQITARIDEELVDWVADHADEHDRSFSQVIIDALEMYRRSLEPFEGECSFGPVTSTTVSNGWTSSARFLAMLEFSILNVGDVDDVVDSMLAAVTDTMRRRGADDIIDVQLHKLAPLNAEVRWTFTNTAANSVPVFGSIYQYGTTTNVSVAVANPYHVSCEEGCDYCMGEPEGL